MSAPAFNTAFEQALQMSIGQVMETMPRDFGGRDLAVAAVSLDQERAEVRFAWGDGVRAAADAQVIGVYLEPGAAPDTVTWQWAWSAALFQPHMMGHGEVLRRHGEQNGYEELAAVEVEAPVQRIWGYAMMAAALNGAAGVVGVKSNDAMILATIGALRPA